MVLERKKKLWEVRTHEPEPWSVENVKIGQYVAAIYDNNVWYEIVEQYLEEFDDFTIILQHPSCGCAIPRHYILSHTSNPTFKGSMGIQYSFNKEEGDASAQHVKLMLHK